MNGNNVRQCQLCSKINVKHNYFCEKYSLIGKSNEHWGKGGGSSLVDFCEEVVSNFLLQFI